MNTTVSVIIPVFNGEEFIYHCLESVKNQTYKDVELLIVDDGSTDTTPEILEQFQEENPEMRIQIYTLHNGGQGRARNFALDRATGDFVLFVDADDWLNELTIERSLYEIELHNADFVHFDYQYFFERNQRFVYNVQEHFSHIETLEGDDCDFFLRVRHYFTVNNLYRREFLDKHRIRYGEGYSYEDFEFIVQLATRAQKIRFLHAPLYNVRVNDASTTKTGHDTSKHATSFMRAAMASFVELRARTNRTEYYLAHYLFKKFVLYYRKRVPRGLRKKFRKRFFALLISRDIQIPDRIENDRVFPFFKKYRVLEKHREFLFTLLVWYAVYFRPKTKRFVRRTKWRAKKVLRRIPHNELLAQYRSFLEQPLIRNSIVFMGFDYRFDGNSKYLFQQVLQNERFKDFQIRFVTDDEQVASQYRLEPRSVEFFNFVARAEHIVLETWNPNWMAKREDTTWVQLWHGTPIKRMLFDSAEAPIMQENKRHKIQLAGNIRKWDYLAVDSHVGKLKARSSFLIDKEKVAITGYPRVKFLLDNQENDSLKSVIRERLNINEQTKIILYAPTWRDYNYQKTAVESDFSYQLDLSVLAQQLRDSGLDDFVILDKQHSYHFREAVDMGQYVKNVADIDPQELLLIADMVISDFSSIIFDAMAINIPIVLYVNDFDRFIASRGLYEDMWDDLKTLATDSTQVVAEQVLAQIGEKRDYTEFTDYMYRSDQSITKLLLDSPQPLSITLHTPVKL